jgi:hypothetical protein
MSDPRPSDGLADFAIFALEHGVNSVEEGGPLIPFVMWAKEGDDSEMQRFVTPLVEEGVKLAQEFARTLSQKADAAVVAWDGYLTRDGNREDAIFVQAYEAGDKASFIFAQRYTPAADAPAEAVGNPILCAVEEPLFA